MAPGTCLRHWRRRPTRQQAPAGGKLEMVSMAASTTRSRFFPPAFTHVRRLVVQVVTCGTHATLAS